MRVAAATLGLALVLMFAGYAVGATTTQAIPGGVVSALALLAIAGSGILYAWRPGPGGSVD